MYPNNQYFAIDSIYAQLNYGLVSNQTLGSENIDNTSGVCSQAASRRMLLASDAFVGGGQVLSSLEPNVYGHSLNNTHCDHNNLQPSNDVTLNNNKELTNQWAPPAPQEYLDSSYHEFGFKIFAQNEGSSGYFDMAEIVAYNNEDDFDYSHNHNNHSVSTPLIQSIELDDSLSNNDLPDDLKDVIPYDFGLYSQEMEYMLSDVKSELEERSESFFPECQSVLDYNNKIALQRKEDTENFV